MTAGTEPLLRAQKSFSSANLSNLSHLSRSAISTRNFKHMNILDMGRHAFNWQVSNLDASMMTGGGNEDDFVAAAKTGGTSLKDSPVFIFWMLALMGIAQMFQYSTVNLLVAAIPGNKFVNGILFGASESFSMIFSSILL